MRCRLRRAVDRQKDQSYFLFGVRPQLFSFVRFPLGEMTKPQVREAARRLGLPNWNKPDSQQICFIPDGDHMAFLEARGGAGPAGAIVDEDGTAIGQHAGTHRFTVGQRKGLPPAPDQNARFVLAHRRRQRARRGGAAQRPGSEADASHRHALVAAAGRSRPAPL